MIIFQFQSIYDHFNSLINWCISPELHIQIWQGCYLDNTPLFPYLYRVAHYAKIPIFVQKVDFEKTYFNVFKNWTQCLKITQKSRFLIMAFFTNFCLIRIDLSDNTVRP